jgi:alpha-galactosidase
MSARITIVGGGSSHWTPRLLRDFALTPALADATVTLHDIDADALPRMLDVAAVTTKCLDADLAVSATTDLDAALDGAAFVLTALSVGGFASMAPDIEIPERYGVRQTVGDSVGPGGVSRSLRSIPVVLGIARAMERRSPDALLVNVSNPLSALCRAVNRETAIRAVGLCNEVIGTEFVLSLLFDADLRRIDPTVAGVNHLPLLTGLDIAGDDGFAMLRAVLDDPASVADDPLWMDPPEGMHWRKVSTGERWTKGDVLANIPLKRELFQRFGVLPGSHETHVVEFFPNFVTAVSDGGRAWGAHHYGIVGHTADKEDDDRDVAELLASREVLPFPSGELAATLLDGLVGGEARTLPVNIPNVGQVGGVDADVVVECMGVADATGLRPRDEATVGGWLGEVVRRVARSQELTVDAAVTGSRTRALEAMLTDPVAGALPYEHVVAMTDDLLAATRPWLPQFP